jgi:hypothetical protein
MRFVIGAALIALLGTLDARAEEYILAIKPGGPYAVTPGGELARIRKQRPLPNAFGFGDIFGRKVESGSVQFVYFGQAKNGHAMIRRIDIEIFSTATTMSRTPGFITGQAWSSGYAWGTFSSGAQMHGMFPVDETNTVLPPRIVDFLADPAQPIPLPTGHVVSIHSIEPQRLVFSVAEPRSPKRSRARKGSDSTKPDWVPW